MLLFFAGRPLLLATALVGASLQLAHGQAAKPSGAPPAAPATIRLGGLLATPRTLTAADLAKLPRREQATTDKDGNKHLYQGWALADVLHLGGAPAGKGIHGPVLAEAVLATAADGYRAVYALPEIDPDFAPQTILLADRRDGQPLPAHDGPYQVVVPLEKKPARWVRQVTGFEVVNVR
ncbi:molybdopterin-binding protein [Hymenobacter sp. RP-2-7]|uniref:Molybdopterin-binding protein n=1 Tax=Hymenobacter polaris TaxID=2682546 RepID=A0A7Y0FMX7_9BACT|nr:molybdopterin-binding protein [Hymenobacter polaris]NML65879.1 molybdopterin-binding protein [Hymenobacter polaris]